MTLIPFAEMVKSADKIYIYALVHPLIENDVKYVGAALELSSVIAKLKLRKSNVARWVQFLCRQNTEPEVVLLQEVNISEDKNSWYEYKSWWIQHFKSEGHQLLNYEPKLFKLSDSQRNEVMRIAQSSSWTEERRAKHKEIMIEVIRKAVKKRREVHKLASEVLKLQRYYAFLEGLERHKK